MGALPGGIVDHPESGSGPTRNILLVVPFRSPDGSTGLTQQSVCRALPPSAHLVLVTTAMPGSFCLLNSRRVPAANRMRPIQTRNVRRGSHGYFCGRCLQYQYERAQGGHHRHEESTLRGLRYHRPPDWDVRSGSLHSAGTRRQQRHSQFVADMPTPTRMSVSTSIPEISCRAKPRASNCPSGALPTRSHQPLPRRCSVKRKRSNSAIAAVVSPTSLHWRRAWRETLP